MTIIALANWGWFENWQNDKVKNRGEDYKARKKCFMQKMWKHVLSIYPHLDDKVIETLNACYYMLTAA